MTNWNYLEEDVLNSGAHDLHITFLYYILRILPTGTQFAPLSSCFLTGLCDLCCHPQIDATIGIQNKKMECNFI